MIEPDELTVSDGVAYEASKAKNSLSWREANLVRWDNGKMSPIGGWERFDYTAPPTWVRAIHQWFDNSKNLWTAYLCDGFLYVEHDGDLFDISPTPAIQQYASGGSTGGYGDDTYNEDTYGTPRDTVPNRKEAGPVFKLDNWGEDLLAMSSADGRLLRWVPTLTPDPSEVVPNAPENNTTFVVTPERFVILFGAGGVFNKQQWCDQEDIEDWTPGLTSKAGSYPVEPAAPIVAALNIGEQGNLFFTTKLAYVTRYIGLPYIFEKGDEIGEGVTPISAQTLVRALSGSIWAAQSGFYYFNGTSIEPIQCDIWDWIDGLINWTTARFTAAAVNMTENGEYWFFFPSGESDHNDMVAIFSYKPTSRWWSMGKVSRSAGFSANFTTFPVMADRMTVYQHESGQQYPDAPENPWVESYVVNLKSGGVMTQVNQIFPEVEGEYSALRFSLAYRIRRTPDDEVYSPKRRLQANGAVDFGVVGRDFRLRIDYEGGSVLPWGVGPIQVSAAPRGVKP